MKTSSVQDFFELGPRTVLDRWLRFAAPVQARYDAETGRIRVRELRSAILLGLVLYNVYNVTSIVLLADSLALSVFLRLGLVTPVSLGLAWLIGHTTPVWTERLVGIGIVNAYVVPVFLFWWTSEPLGLFTFGELSLSIVFANMVLALRFTHAAAFTVMALSTTLLAVATKAGLDPALRFAFAVQIATACLFTLYANYRQERQRVRDYLAALDATLQADRADAARQTFHDLSRTDALTRLPNRRHLTERLEEWLAEPHEMAVMMIDVDHFKLYNDALGHPAGDDCLRRVSAVFAAAAAENADTFCARFGGEEFTFAVRNTSMIEAARWARTLVRSIRALEIPHPSRADGIGVVTISVGLVRCPGGAPRALEEILSAADRVLYAAKRRGRNGFAMDEVAGETAQLGG